MPNAQRGQLTTPALASDLVAGLFWLLAIVQLINLNHVANMVYGSGLLVTAGLLALCVTLIALVPVQLRPVLGRHGLCMIGAVGSYAVIATSVALLAGLSWAPSPWEPLRPWLAIIVTIASAAAGTFLLRRHGVPRLLIGVLVLLGITAALILVSPWLIEHVYVSLSHAQFAYYRRDRYTGTFINPIQAGMAACNAAVVALAILGHLRVPRWRLLAGGVLIVATIAVALTVSRTPAIALGLLLVLFLVSIAPRRQHRGRGAAKVFVAVLVGLIALAFVYRETSLVSHQMFDRLTLANDRTWDDLSKRFAHLAYGFELIRQSPLIGNGLTQLEMMKGAEICHAGIAVCGVHNSFLQYWGEAGIGPVILLVAAFVAFLATAWRMPRSLATDTAFGWVLVFALHCLVSHAVPHNYLWYSFLFGLSCALLAHAAAESPPGPRPRAVAPSATNGEVTTGKPDCSGRDAA